VRHLAERFAVIPGVVAVSLGGSRATGLATEHSDWDFGLSVVHDRRRTRRPHLPRPRSRWRSGLPRPRFPNALRGSAPPVWRNLANGALKFAHAHGLRNDGVACAGNLAMAVLSESHARLCERGEWYLPEKDMAKRTNLTDDLDGIGNDPLAVVERVRERLRQ
jgi:hypothetical protein